MITATVLGRLVTRADDDRDCPAVGRVMWREGDDRVAVAWGDERFAKHPQIAVEFLDELAPFTVGPRS